MVGPSVVGGGGEGGALAAGDGHPDPRQAAAARPRHHLAPHREAGHGEVGLGDGGMGDHQLGGGRQDLVIGVLAPALGPEGVGAGGHGRQQPVAAGVGDHMAELVPPRHGGGRGRVGGAEGGQGGGSGAEQQHETPPRTSQHTKPG